MQFWNACRHSWLCHTAVSFEHLTSVVVYAIAQALSFLLTIIGAYTIAQDSSALLIVALEQVFIQAIRFSPASYYSNGPHCISVVTGWCSRPQYQRDQSYPTPTTKRKIYIVMVLCYQPTLALSNPHKHMACLLTGDMWRRASMWVLRASWQAAIWANSVRIQDRWEQEAASARTRQSHHQCTKCYSLTQATFIRLSLLLLDWVQNLVM